MSPDNPQHPQKLPGNGLLGWLGRQVAYVRKALSTDVSTSKTIYRDCKIEEKPLPQDPKIKLRRTVIDEVVVDRDPPASQQKKTP
ncbi:MAG: hypothetical protein ABSD28_03305 [Tepidisphaeraceae bacterium]|jgi:hypothetical protein